MFHGGHVAVPLYAFLLDGHFVSRSLLLYWCPTAASVVLHVSFKILVLWGYSLKPGNTGSLAALGFFGKTAVYCSV